MQELERWNDPVHGEIVLYYAGYRKEGKQWRYLYKIVSTTEIMETESPLNPKKFKRHSYERIKRVIESTTVRGV